MWITGEAGWEGMVIQSNFSRIKRAVWTFACRVSKIEGVLRMMLMPSDALTANNPGIAAEKTKEEPLIRWCSTTTLEPAQNPPQELRPMEQEPRSMSTFEAGTL